MQFRLTSLILTIFLLTSLAPAFAQGISEEVVTIRIDGSLLMQDLMTALAEGFAENIPDVPAEFAIQTNGPNAAFAAFCAGELDLVMSSRFITDDELAACEDLEVIENLVAYQGVVAVTTPSIQAGAVCITMPQLDQLYGLPAEGSENTVQQLDPLLEEPAPLTVYSPNPGTPAADVLQFALPSGELRSDLEFYDDAAQVVAALTEDSEAAIAILTLPEFEELGEGLTPLEIIGETGSCYAPNVPNFETRSYPAQISLMLYINADRSEEGVLNLFLQYLSTQDGAPAISAENGFTGASGATYGRNLNNLNQRATGRTFSRATSPVAITSAAEGEVTVAGSPLSGPLVNALSTNFTAEFPAATVNSDLFGTAAGQDALCNGEADVLFTVGSGEVDCDGVYSAEIGTQALVFAVAADVEDLPACITIDALATAFAAPPQEGDEIPLADEREIPRGVTNWNELGAGFPDLPLTLFLPGRSSPEVDQVFAMAGAQDVFSRSDEEENVFYAPRTAGDDGLWRAAALANLDAGGLTVISWNDYQNSEHRSDLRLLEVDASAGCIAPDETTFADGSYPFATSYSVHFSRNAMGDPVVGAFMWSLLGEQALTLLDSLDLVSNNADDLRLRRDDVFVLIEEAASQPEPEATEAAPAEEEGEGGAEPTEESDE